MNAQHFTPAAVHKQLSTVKGSGPDVLHPFMLQILADFLAELINALYNKSLMSAEVPQNCRKAIICPIFEKEDPENKTNYRPVSKTSVLCKIFEKLLKQALHTRSKSTASFLRRLPALVVSPKVQSLAHYFFC